MVFAISIQIVEAVAMASCRPAVPSHHNTRQLGDYLMAGGTKAIPDDRLCQMVPVCGTAAMTSPTMRLVELIIGGIIDPYFLRGVVHHRRGPMPWLYHPPGCPCREKNEKQGPNNEKKMADERLVDFAWGIIVLQHSGRTHLEIRFNRKKHCQTMRNR
jgi:hypothetical protein